jgi:hypothetical protein
MTSRLAESGIKADDYCLFGLATCFIREDGETKEIEVIEPIPSAALEALLKGIPTSYKLAVAKNVGDVINEDQLQKPTEFPAESQFSEDFVFRTFAATRTYKNNPSAKEHIAIGSCKTDLNYSLERKRVLNNIKIVSDDDNVKQHPHTHKQI